MEQADLNTLPPVEWKKICDMEELFTMYGCVPAKMLLIRSDIIFDNDEADEILSKLVNFIIKISGEKPMQFVLFFSNRTDNTFYASCDVKIRSSPLAKDSKPSEPSIN